MSGNLMHMAYVNWLEEHGAPIPAPIPVPPAPTPVPPGPVPPPEPSPYPQDWVLLRFADPYVIPTGRGKLVRWEKKTDSAYNDWYLRIGMPKRDAPYFYDYLRAEYQEVPDLVITKSGNDVTLKFPHDEEYHVTQDDANAEVDLYIGEGVLVPGSTATLFVGDEMDEIIFHCAEADEKYPGYRIGPEAMYYTYVTYVMFVEGTLVGNVCTLKLPQIIVEILEEEMGTALNTDSLNRIFIPLWIEEGMLLEGTKGTVTFETIGDEEFATMTIEGPSGEYIPDDNWTPNLFIRDKFEIIDDDWAYGPTEGGLFEKCTGLTAIRSTFSKLSDGSNMFRDCTGLTSITENLFPNLTDGSGMFYGCTGLTSIPENMFSNLTAGELMFFNCFNVKTGIYELYTFLSGTGKVTNHSLMFTGCGIHTEEGRAALAMIPSDWK